jgi:hypothetical protein
VFTWGGVEGLKARAIDGRVHTRARPQRDVDPTAPLRTAGSCRRLAPPRLGLFRTRKAQGCRRGTHADLPVPERPCRTARRCVRSLRIDHKAVRFFDSRSNSRRPRGFTALASWHVRRGRRTWQRLVRK